MKRIPFAIAVVGLGFLAGTTCNMVAQGKAPLKYDVAAQQTVNGTIQEVKDYQCAVTGTLGSHIKVKTSDGILEVHLAPTAYLQKDYETMTLRAGDSVRIVGSKFTLDGQPAMLAKTLTLGNTTFFFRDEKGRPLW